MSAGTVQAEPLARVLGGVMDDLHAAETALDDSPLLSSSTTAARSLVSMAIGRLSAAIEFLDDAELER